MRLSSQPVENADVFLEEGVGLSAKTDSNGRYTIKNIPEGTYHVIAQKGNMKMRSKAISLNTESAPEGEKEVEEVEVKEANTIFNITLLDITGKKIVNNEGAEIDFWNSKTTLKNDGTFLTPTTIPDELAVATNTFYGFINLEGGRYMFQVKGSPLNQSVKINFTWHEKTEPVIPVVPSPDVFAGGSGMTTDPYLIETIEQLKYIGSNTYTLSYSYKLKNDIDLANIEWTPIDDFNGNFDGNNKTIKNITIDQPNKDNLGLFGKNSCFVIKDLVLENVKITGRANLGAIGGDCAINATNCVIKSGSISGEESVGGLVGVIGGRNHANGLYHTFDSCCNEGCTIKCNGSFGGGLIGKSMVDFTNCHNKANVTAKGHVGGISSIGGSFKKCSNTGIITNDKRNSQSSLIEQGIDDIARYDFTNAVDISEYNTVGGLAGFIICSIKAEDNLSDCFNTGNIINNNTSGFAGGLVGVDNSGSSEYLKKNNYNTGSISNAGGWSGGLFGYSYGRVFNCYNIGNVTGCYRVGGISGEGDLIENCYNKGLVSGDKNPINIAGKPSAVGGIVGYGFNQTANCYNDEEGVVTGGELTGGIAGYGEAFGCINYANVIGSANGTAGGIIGKRSSYTDSCVAMCSYVVGEKIGRIFGEGRGDLFNLYANKYMKDSENGSSDCFKNKGKDQQDGEDLDITTKTSKEWGDFWNNLGFTDEKWININTSHPTLK